MYIFNRASVTNAFCQIYLSDKYGHFDFIFENIYIQSRYTKMNTFFIQNYTV